MVNRNLLLSGFFLLPWLLSAPLMAADIETVTVNASSLAGTWYIAADFQPEQKTPLRLHCRIEGAAAPAMFCFERQGTSFDYKDGKLRIAWYPTLAQNAVIEAQLTSATSFAGRERVHMLGLTVLNSTLTGVKQEPDPGATDRGGKAALLQIILSELAHGVLSRPYDARFVRPAETQLPRMLGAVTAITYIGTADEGRREERMLPDFYSLYAVTFENGRRFCGLHQRDDGVLDAFRCV